MREKLNKIRKDDPNFDKKMVNMLADTMPQLLFVLIDGETYDNHIGSKDLVYLAESFITNNKGEKIGLKWDYDTVMNTVKNYVNLNEMDFYPCDIWLWANVKYGDMAHIIDDMSVIIEYALSELMDDDFPFYPASQRAYCWLKKHIENKN